MRFKITKSEWIFSILILIGGKLAYSKGVLTFLNGLTPIQGLLVYYSILFVIFFIMVKAGFTVGHDKIKSWNQILGVLLISYSIFVVINWENAYVQYTTHGNMDQASTVFYASEDGVTFDFWMQRFNNPETAKNFTIYTAFAASLLGFYLASKPKVSLL